LPRSPGWDIGAIRVKNGLGPKDAEFWQRVWKKLRDGEQQISK
jgi:hypothetical protein